MNGRTFTFAGHAAMCLTVAVGCSSSAGGGSLESGQCPTAISAAPGTNNGYTMMNGTLADDYGGPDGSAKFSTICLRLADVPQTLAITVLGAKPAAGTTYTVVTDNAPGNIATVEYAEGNNGTKVWGGTGGTVKIESVARKSIGLSFAQVIMAPEAGKTGNTASGSMTLTGSEQADDVLGFVP